MSSLIGDKGQVTLPKFVRESLNLKPGDRVKFFVRPDGGAILLPCLPPSALRGMIRPRKARRVTVKNMAEAIAKGAAESSRAARRSDDERR